ncbi:hypothetical protein LINPERPRIM_LOCUS18786 [Linum perenne]
MVYLRVYTRFLFLIVILVITFALIVWVLPNPGLFPVN